MIKKICFCVISLLTLNSCLEFKDEPSMFFYENNKSSVELIIKNGNNYLIYDTPNRVDFKWINIDPKTSLIYGSGIKILEAKNNITKTEIGLPSNYLENDSLNIKLIFEVNGEKINTVFNIPVVSQTEAFK